MKCGKYWRLSPALRSIIMICAQALVQLLDIRSWIENSLKWMLQVKRLVYAGSFTVRRVSLASLCGTHNAENSHIQHIDYWWNEDFFNSTFKWKFNVKWWGMKAQRRKEDENMLNSKLGWNRTQTQPKRFVKKIEREKKNHHNKMRTTHRNTREVEMKSETLRIFYFLFSFSLFPFSFLTLLVVRIARIFSR